MTARTTLRIALPAHDDLLDAFYRDVYLPEFAHQREPVEVWKAQLGAEPGDGYQLCISVTGEHLLDPAQRRLDGGIVCELYPGSGCGLLTYLVVAPAARRAGLGRALLDGARAVLAEAAGDRGLALGLVLGEISDPRRKVVDCGAATAAWRRLEQFQRWGARVLDVPYVQPDLGAGLGRDAELVLVGFFDDPPPADVDGALLTRFLCDFYTVTEGAPPVDGDAAAMLAAIGERVAVARLAAPGS